FICHGRAPQIAFGRVTLYGDTGDKSSRPRPGRIQSKDGGSKPKPVRPIFRGNHAGGHTMLNPVAPLPLKDPSLFRQANYLNGKWVEADNGQTIVIKNPATGEAVGEVP